MSGDNNDVHITTKRQQLMAHIYAVPSEL